MSSKQRLAVDISARIAGEVSLRAVEEVLSEYEWLGARFDQLFAGQQRALASLTRTVQRVRQD